MDRPGLADFLRARREALQPSDVGLPAGARRRTAGLRREEIAAVVGMSSDYWARLEQRRGPQPSDQMLTAIARGLRLDLDERDHLFRLAGHEAPRRARLSPHVSPGLMRVLDRLDDTPAPRHHRARRDPGAEPSRRRGLRRRARLDRPRPQRHPPLVRPPGGARPVPGTRP